MDWVLAWVLDWFFSDGRLGALYVSVAVFDGVANLEYGTKQPVEGFIYQEHTDRYMIFTDQKKTKPAPKPAPKPVLDWFRL